MSGPISTDTCKESPLIQGKDGVVFQERPEPDSDSVVVERSAMPTSHGSDSTGIVEHVRTEEGIASSLLMRQVWGNLGVLLGELGATPGLTEVERAAISEKLFGAAYDISKRTLHSLGYDGDLPAQEISPLNDGTIHFNSTYRCEHCVSSHDPEFRYHVTLTLRENPAPYFIHATKEFFGGTAFLRPFEPEFASGGVLLPPGSDEDFDDIRGNMERYIPGNIHSVCVSHHWEGAFKAVEVLRRSSADSGTFQLYGVDPHLNPESHEMNDVLLCRLVDERRIHDLALAKYLGTLTFKKIPRDYVAANRDLVVESVTGLADLPSISLPNGVQVDHDGIRIALSDGRKYDSPSISVSGKDLTKASGPAEIVIGSSEDAIRLLEMAASRPRLGELIRNRLAAIDPAAFSSRVYMGFVHQEKVNCAEIFTAPEDLPKFSDIHPNLRAISFLFLPYRVLYSEGTIARKAIDVHNCQSRFPVNVEYS